ncbi:transketolase family protein [Nitrospira sp. M1]
MSAVTVRQQFAETMHAVGRSDKSLVVLVGDISHSILQPFAKECPGRYFNVGICEPTMMSMAAGMSKLGFFPVIHTIAPFLIERAFEQIKLDFCYHQLGGNIITVGSAFDYANLGCTHHCYGDFALLKTLPDVQLTYPGSADEFDSLFRQSYANNRLTYFRLPGRDHGQQFRHEQIVLGKGIRVCTGSNLTLIATGPQLKNTLEAKALLQEAGWHADVLYFHTWRPLDKEMIRVSVRKTGRVVVIEEHMRSGGLGDEVLRTLAGQERFEFSSLAIPDQYVTGYGSYDNHCEHLGLTPKGICARVLDEFGTRQILKGKRKLA